MKYKSEPIRSVEEFKKQFESIGNEAKMLALQHAWDTRKFEIDLYWKRAAYFWAFIVLAFGGFFGLALAENAKVPDKPELQFIVSCVGLVFSFGWYLANRGSKFWHENWEKQVDLLEDEVVGPLQKIALAKESFSMVNPLAPYKFSVTKINQVLSLFVTILWLFLAIRAFSTSYRFVEPFKNFNVWAVMIITIAAISSLFLTLISNRNSFSVELHKIENETESLK